ncbi:hypothetical protein SAY87_016914 [Trapa incisa]|uniref:Uncharacterized protein n=1 Tax=Trapa incisa TaxID=236973 RepID=A0AAN7L235_9MYRT|nr:hypothetical protein SAY87_016914 [Trapa incisa]
MGNCQAVDAAALVIQHPNGRIDRLYWPVTASEVMRTNPGHYVSLIIPLPSAQVPEEEAAAPAEKTRGLDKKPPVRFTRVKLLRPNETLALGHAYRLVTSQEVMKVLKAKKYTKKKERMGVPESAEKPALDGHRATDNSGGHRKSERSEIVKENKTHLEEGEHGSRRRQRAALTNVAATGSRPKYWRPTLHSISEGGS